MVCTSAVQKGVGAGSKQHTKQSRGTHTGWAALLLLVDVQERREELSTEGQKTCHLARKG